MAKSQKQFSSDNKTLMIAIVAALAITVFFATNTGHPTGRVVSTTNAMAPITAPMIFAPSSAAQTVQRAISAQERQDLIASVRAQLEPYVQEQTSAVRRELMTQIANDRIWQKQYSDNLLQSHIATNHRATPTPRLNCRVYNAPAEPTTATQLCSSAQMTCVTAIKLRITTPVQSTGNDVNTCQGSKGVPITVTENYGCDSSISTRSQCNPQGSVGGLVTLSALVESKDTAICCTIA